jgi:hypothetical protein
MTWPPYLRLGSGDVNGFFGLVVDKLSVLALLAAVLIGGFGIPASIVFGRTFPREFVRRSMSPWRGDRCR